MFRLMLEMGSWFNQNQLFESEPWKHAYGGKVLLGSAEGLQIVSTSLTSFTIGRDPSNAIVLDGGFVSRNHARIFRQGLIFKKWYIEDLGSKTGTVIDRAPIREQLKPNTPRELKTQDRIGLGGTWITISF